MENELTDKQTDNTRKGQLIGGWVRKWTNGPAERQPNGRTDKWTEGRRERWKDERQDGRIDKETHLHLVLFPSILDGLEDGPRGPAADLQSGHVPPVPPLDQQRRFHG